MAIGTPVLIDSNGVQTNSTVIATAAGAHSAGRLLIGAAGFRANEASSTCAQTGSVDGAYAERSNERSFGVIRSWLHIFEDAAAVSTSDTLTAVQSSASEVARSATIDWFGVTGVTDTGFLNNTGQGAPGAGANSGIVSPSAGDWLLIGFLHVNQSANTVTEATGWTALNDHLIGSGADASHSHVAYRIVTADGLTDYSYDPTHGISNGRWVAHILAVPAVVEAATGNLLARRPALRQPLITF